jgi:hypothetical protein
VIFLKFIPEGLVSLNSLFEVQSLPRKLGEYIFNVLTFLTNDVYKRQKVEKGDAKKNFFRAFDDSRDRLPAKTGY